MLHEDFAFGVHLARKKRGHGGFAEYVDLVHHALAEYRCNIGGLVAEGDKVFAKMTFGGIHRNELLGHGPSGNHVSWAGWALFTFDGDPEGRRVSAPPRKELPKERKCTAAGSER